MKNNRDNSSKGYQEPTESKKKKKGCGCGSSRRKQGTTRRKLSR